MDGASACLPAVLVCRGGDTSRLTAWLALLGACCAGMLCLHRRRV
ncbi:MAG: hypothetical protein PUE14_08445 [Clostridia bacterium]|nr:hypothetical protein [Clostridia bacterium]